jgi:hypothetical protein
MGLPSLVTPATTTSPNVVGNGLAAFALPNNQHVTNP